MEGERSIAKFYTGRPETWYIKYSVTWSVKRTPAGQSTTLPKRKNVLLKRGIWAQEVCKELLAMATSQVYMYLSLFPCSPRICCDGHFTLEVMNTWSLNSTFTELLRDADSCVTCACVLQTLKKSQQQPGQHSCFFFVVLGSNLDPDTGLPGWDVFCFLSSFRQSWNNILN
jgi:hypothetical protein